MSNNRRVTTVSIWPDPVAKRIGVSSPFNGDFIAKARGLGGKWDGVSQRWMFPASEEAALRALCIEIYGTDSGEPKPTREGLEQRLAQHMAAIISIQEQLDKLDAAEGNPHTEGDA